MGLNAYYSFPSGAISTNKSIVISLPVRYGSSVDCTDGSGGLNSTPFTVCTNEFGHVSTMLQYGHDVASNASGEKYVGATAQNKKNYADMQIRK